MQRIANLLNKISKIENEIFEEKELELAKQIQDMADNNSPLWWKRFKNDANDMPPTIEQLECIENEMLKVGDGKFEFDKESGNQTAEGIKSRGWNIDEKGEKLSKEDLERIFDSKEGVWKVHKGKAMGPDGWCEEAMILILGCGKKAKEDMDKAIELMVSYEILPQWCKIIRVKPILTPDKPQDTMEANH